MQTRVSLGQLAAAGVRLRPAEAVAIVSEICRQHASGGLPGVPSPGVIKLTSDGQIVTEGPVTMDEADVTRAARLLDHLLAGWDAPTEYRASGALRLVLQRGLQTLDLPAYGSLEDFCAALHRFSTPEVAQTVRDLYGAWERHHDVADAEAIHTLTISDVRRARRATGLSLGYLSLVTSIPAATLRAFEWGDMRQWRYDAEGRAAVIRYARAAGLDDDLVLSVAWPMIEQNGARGIDAAAAEPTDAGSALETIPAAGEPARVVLRGAPSLWARGVAVAAIAAVGILAGTQPARRQGPAPPPPALAAQASPAVMREAPVVTMDTAPAARPAPADTDTVPALANRPASEASRPAHLTRVISAAYSPTFDGSGTAMFFHRNTGGASSLLRADTDGRGAIVKVTPVIEDRAQNFHIRPSPDGSLIAFDSDRNGVRGVFVAEADGDNPRLVSGPGFASVPSWSPDGRSLAFVKAEAKSPRVWNLWTADLSTGELRRLTSYRVGQPWGGSWFPDGTRIAYSHETELVVLDLATGRRRRFASPRTGHLVRTPAVSPDGRRIIFQVHGDGVWLLDLTGGRMRRILADRSAEEYTWAPDGRQVAFHSRRSGEWGVWLMGS